MQNSPRRLAALWLIIAFLGCGLALAALLMIVLPFVLPDAVLGSYAAILVSIGLIAIMLGIGLLVAGIKGWRDKESVPINTRWGWLILLLIMVLLGGLASLIPADLQSAPIFAPFHFGMIVLPAFIGLLLIMRLSGPRDVPTFRQVVVAMTGGVSSVLLALPLEIVGFVVVVALVFAGASIFPAGQAEVSRLLSIFRLWVEVPPANMDAILSIAASPVAIVGIALVLSCLTPLIEEFVKTLVMGVMGIWMRPGLGKAFTWGLACGLGFAMVEGITNGSIGLGGAGWWFGGVFARMLASMMHALTSGLLGLGWGSLWERKWWRLPLFYAVSVTLHGLWNFSVLLFVIGGILSSTQLWSGGALALIGGGLLVILILLVIVALIAIPLLLRRRGNAATAPNTQLSPTENPV